MKAIKVTRPNLDSAGYILGKHEISSILGEVESMLDYGDTEDSILIEVIEISDEEFNNLEEFSGW